MPKAIVAEYFRETIHSPLQSENGHNLKGYLQAVLNGTREAIFLLGVNGEILLYNDFARILIMQFTNADISVTPNLVTVVPEFRKKDVRHALEKAAGGEMISYEVLYPAGKWLEVCFFPVQQSSQVQTVEICGTIKDITERKQREEELRKSESRYYSLFESMMEGVIFQSLNKFDNSANASAAEILETGADALKENGLLSDTLKWVDRKLRPINLEDVFAPKLCISKSVRGKVVGLMTPSKIKWVLINAEPVKKRRSDEMAGVFTFIDFSAIIQYQEEHALLSQVMKEISNIVVITDKDEKITWANQSFNRITGYSLEEARGKKPGQLFHGPLKDRAESAKIKEATKKGIPVQGEILNYTRDGGNFWSNYSIHPVKDEEGNVMKYFSIQSDITEMKRIQEEILKQKLDYQQKLSAAKLKAQEEKQTQIGQELHDNINQILAVSQLYAGMIATGQGDAIKNAMLVREYLQLAVSEIRKLSHELVTPRFKEQRLQDLFQNALKIIGATARVHLEIDSEANLLPDELKLTVYRIAQEQINNINKHAKASNIWVKLAMESSNVCLMIRDDGKGFEPGLAKKGIGLNNIHSRAEALRGGAQILSRPGEGCVLNVVIPLPENPDLSLAC